MARSGLLIDKKTRGGSGKRRVLTALNYDLVGSTVLLDSLEIEDYQDLIADFQHEVHQAVAALSGRLHDIEGDGGVATFPVEMDAKDAASLAIQAGFEIIAACKRVSKYRKRNDLHVRVGIATSMSLVQNPDRPAGPPKITGAALALAARLQTLAAPDTIFVSQETRSIVRRSHTFQLQGTHAVKGFAEPETIWRAIGYRRKVDRYFAFGRLNATMANRADALRELERSWQLATNGLGQALLIEGKAGIGKSRLVHRLRAFMRENGAHRIMFQCQPSGQRTALHPLLQALPNLEEGNGQQRSAAAINRLFRESGIYDREAIDIFVYLLGAEGASRGLKGASLDVIRERSGWAARHCIEALCAEGPLLLVIEDIHWIDPTSLQLLSEALQAIGSLPVFVVLTARPFLKNSRPELPNTRIMRLNPLERKYARQIVFAKFPRYGETASAAMLDLIERVSGGVPLYIEEICQWASENSHSAQETLTKNRSPNRLSAFEAVVAARLGQLGASSEVACAAAVAGTRFDVSLLRIALPELNANDIEAAITELMKQGFVVQVTLAEPALYGFRHALIRETLYKSLMRARRQGIHGRIYAAVQGNREIAPWIGTATLAEHAENAGLLPEAIECLLAAGSESAARSAMTVARQLLEHALGLCREIEDTNRRESLMLRTMTVLGPVLTTSEGPGSEPAQKLYMEGIGIARQRPPRERAAWFPIYWGWWFTGSDVNGERAHALLDEMRDVDDVEVQLQSRHCVWAIDFYLGQHGNCVNSVDEALPLYEDQPRLQNPASYGGHDTKVCGLVHRGLSLWFTGQTSKAIASLNEAKTWAEKTSHVGSIAHALINSAMLATYRRDFTQLRSDIVALRNVTEKNRLPTLAATAQILEGWCSGLEGDAVAGRDVMRRGLDIHRKLQTPEDYPVYCTMLAEILAKSGDAAEALQLLNSIVEDRGSAGHSFWLAELHRRRAHLMALGAAAAQDILTVLELSLEIAARQHAVPLLLCSYETLSVLQPTSQLVEKFKDQVEAAKRDVDPAVPLFANPENIILTGVMV